MLGWLLVEKIRDGQPTSLGAASGAVAGLVAITPACSSVAPMGAIALGLIAGVVCALAVGLKFRFGFDDSLDVVGVHLVGGLIGTLLIGFLGRPSARPASTGLFYGGGVDQLGKQAVGAVAVLIYSFVLSYIIALVVKATWASGRPTRTRSTASTKRARRDRHTTSPPAQHQRCGTPRPDAATPRPPRTSRPTRARKLSR